MKQLLNLLEMREGRRTKKWTREKSQHGAVTILQ